MVVFFYFLFFFNAVCGLPCIGPDRQISRNMWLGNASSKVQDTSVQGKYPLARGGWHSHAGAVIPVKRRCASKNLIKFVGPLSKFIWKFSIYSKTKLRIKVCTPLTKTLDLPQSCPIQSNAPQDGANTSSIKNSITTHKSCVEEAIFLYVKSRYPNYSCLLVEGGRGVLVGNGVLFPFLG